TFTEADRPHIEKIRKYYFKTPDSTLQASGNEPSNIPTSELKTLVKSIADTTKNLQIKYQSMLSKVSLKGKNWNLRLKSGETIKSDMLVDATSGDILSSYLNSDPG